MRIKTLRQKTALLLAIHHTAIPKKTDQARKGYSIVLTYSLKRRGRFTMVWDEPLKYYTKLFCGWEG